MYAQNEQPQKRVTDFPEKIHFVLYLLTMGWLLYVELEHYFCQIRLMDDGFIPFASFGNSKDERKLRKNVKFDNLIHVKCRTNYAIDTHQR